MSNPAAITPEQDGARLIQVVTQLLGIPPAAYRDHDLVRSLAHNGIRGFHGQFLIMTDDDIDSLVTPVDAERHHDGQRTVRIEPLQTHWITLLKMVRAFYHHVCYHRQRDVDPAILTRDEFHEFRLNHDLSKKTVPWRLRPNKEELEDVKRWQERLNIDTHAVPKLSNWIVFDEWQDKIESWAKARGLEDHFSREVIPYTTVLQQEQATYLHTMLLDKCTELAATRILQENGTRPHIPTIMREFRLFSNQSIQALTTNISRCTYLTSYRYEDTDNPADAIKFFTNWYKKASDYNRDVDKHNRFTNTQLVYMLNNALQNTKYRDVFKQSLSSMVHTHGNTELIITDFIKTLEHHASHGERQVNPKTRTQDGTTLHKTDLTYPALTGRKGEDDTTSVKCLDDEWKTTEQDIVDPEVAPFLGEHPQEKWDKMSLTHKNRLLKYIKIGDKKDNQRKAPLSHEETEHTKDGYCHVTPKPGVIHTGMPHETYKMECNMSSKGITDSVESSENGPASDTNDTLPRTNQASVPERAPYDICSVMSVPRKNPHSRYAIYPPKDSDSEYQGDSETSSRYEIRVHEFIHGSGSDETTSWNPGNPEEEPATKGPEDHSRSDLITAGIFPSRGGMLPTDDVIQDLKYYKENGYNDRIPHSVTQGFHEKEMSVFLITAEGLTEFGMNRDEFRVLRKYMIMGRYDPSTYPSGWKDIQERLEWEKGNVMAYLSCRYGIDPGDTGPVHEIPIRHKTYTQLQAHTPPDPKIHGHNPTYKVMITQQGGNHAGNQASDEESSQSDILGTLLSDDDLWKPHGDGQVLNTDTELWTRTSGDPWRGGLNPYAGLFPSRYGQLETDEIIKNWREYATNPYEDERKFLRPETFSEKQFTIILPTTWGMTEFGINIGEFMDLRRRMVLGRYHPNMYPSGWDDIWHRLMWEQDNPDGVGTCRFGEGQQPIATARESPVQGPINMHLPWDPKRTLTSPRKQQEKWTRTQDDRWGGDGDPYAGMFPSKDGDLPIDDILNRWEQLGINPYEDERGKLRPQTFLDKDIRILLPTSRGLVEFGVNMQELKDLRRGMVNGRYDPTMYPSGWEDIDERIEWERANPGRELRCQCTQDYYADLNVSEEIEAPCLHSQEEGYMKDQNSESTMKEDGSGNRLVRKYFIRGIRRMYGGFYSQYPAINGEELFPLKTRTNHNMTATRGTNPKDTGTCSRTHDTRANDRYVENTRHIRANITVTYDVSRTITHKNRGALIDRGANGGVIGNDARVIIVHQDTVDVTGIDDHELPQLKMVDAAAKVMTNIGWVIIILQRYAFYGTGRTIHSSGQLEWFNNLVDDRSTKVGGRQCIRTHDGYVIPVDIICGLAYIKMEPYTNEEWGRLPHCVLTSGVWDPSVLDNTVSDAEDWIEVFEKMDLGTVKNPFRMDGSFIGKRVEDKPRQTKEDENTETSGATASGGETGVDNKGDIPNGPEFGALTCHSTPTRKGILRNEIMMISLTSSRTRTDTPYACKSGYKAEATLCVLQMGNRKYEQNDALQLRALLDTGASGVYIKGSAVPVEDRILTGYTKTSLTPGGAIKLNSEVEVVFWMLGVDQNKGRPFCEEMGVIESDQTMYDVIIGREFLLRHRAILDFKNKEIAITMGGEGHTWKMNEGRVGAIEPKTMAMMDEWLYPCRMDLELLGDWVPTLTLTSSQFKDKGTLRTLKALVDTGSQITLFNRRMFKGLKIEYEQDEAQTLKRSPGVVILQKTERTQVWTGGGYLTFEHTFQFEDLLLRTPTQAWEISSTVRGYVTNEPLNIPYDIILGIDTINEMNLVVEYGNLIMEAYGDEIPMRRMKGIPLITTYREGSTMSRLEEIYQMIAWYKYNPSRWKAGIEHFVQTYVRLFAVYNGAARPIDRVTGTWATKKLNEALGGTWLSGYLESLEEEGGTGVEWPEYRKRLLEYIGRCEKGSTTVQSQDEEERWSMKEWIRHRLEYTEDPPQYIKDEVREFMEETRNPKVEGMEIYPGGMIPIPFQGPFSHLHVVGLEWQWLREHHDRVMDAALERAAMKIDDFENLQEESKRRKGKSDTEYFKDHIHLDKGGWLENPYKVSLPIHEEKRREYEWHKERGVKPRVPITWDPNPKLVKDGQADTEWKECMDPMDEEREWFPDPFEWEEEG